MTTVPVFPRCACGHSILAHEINSKRERTACSVYDHNGQCPCQKFTPKDGAP